jgi:hypothetical protein
VALALTILGSLFVAAVAAVLAHRFTSRRDLANRRRELRTEYLLNAYRAVSNAIGRDLQGSPDDARAFERGLADIQLLGSKDQAQMAVKLGRDMTEGGEADPEPLLRSLRDDLREELDLERLSTGVKQTRIVLKPVDR